MKRYTKLSLCLIPCLLLCACSAAPGETAAPLTTAAPIDIVVTTAEVKPAEKTTAAETAAPTAEALTEAPETRAAAVNEEKGFGASDLNLELDGVILTAGTDFTPFAEKIFGGKPEITQGQACIGGGFDKNFSYENGAVTVYTLGGGDRQRIYDIYITLPGYATAEGAVIGTTSRQEVLAMYGTPAFSAGAAERYALPGDTRELSFSFSNNILKGIDLTDSSLR